MSDLGLTLSAFSKAGLSYLKAMLDPGLRRRLDEEITAHVLAEIPRVLHLLEERIEDVRASGCSVHEANVVAQHELYGRGRVEDVELEWEREVTSIGHARLAHLRDPDPKNAVANHMMSTKSRLGTRNDI